MQMYVCKAGIEDPVLGQMSNFFGSAFYMYLPLLNKILRENVFSMIENRDLKLSFIYKVEIYNTLTTIIKIQNSNWKNSQWIEYRIEHKKTFYLEGITQKS